MPEGTSGAVTELLAQWHSGDQGALGQLMPLIYRELRRIAKSRLRDERGGHTLQATDLIHEAYLRMMKHSPREASDRTRFFALASHLMRQVLVDHARKRGSAKRDGGVQVTLNEEFSYQAFLPNRLLHLDSALTDLAAFDQRKSKLLELKYFGGLGGAEVAETLGISIATLTRESRLAEAWVKRYLSEPALMSKTPS